MYIVHWRRNAHDEYAAEYRAETLSHFWEAVAHGAQLADTQGGEFRVIYSRTGYVVFDSSRFDGITPVQL